ncbi:hypothetical protein [Thermomonas sp.]|uniref:hypothetical protein n=1 Tax=Thermomonas sp. TaxID=1971895 RepID=UPI002488C7C3|nr:hypothetical protein [Thermomonas sp.]MDI1254136.1 hypothetical protein [Thermomonas sp.]
MHTVVLLVDNDVLLSAAHWGLLDMVPTLVGATWAEVAVLASLPPRARKADPKLFKDPAVAATLVPYLAQCTPMPDPDVSLIARLQGRPDIDVGEQVLFAATGGAAEAFVLTGDKRAIRALALLHAEGVIPELTGRVLCMEHLLWHALSVLGPDELLRRVRKYPDRDMATLAIVGRTEAKSQPQIEEGLTSYLMNLNQASPHLMARGHGLD